VLACTDRPEVNAAIAAEAERRRIWCVRADDATASSAWIPAVGRSGTVTVAVDADRDPRRAVALREHCLKAVEAAVSRGGEAGNGRGDRGQGRVPIVGGGPGDPGLMTVKARHRLVSADVVVVDRLAPLEVLDELAPDVQVVDAAKVPGGRAMRQEHINRALVEHARAGRAVVRLKGGDPFVFGRGMEEVHACVAAGVAVELIPGVTSAIAVPGLAGIPVTHRGTAQGFTVVTGHVPSGDPRSTIDWASLARAGSTLVLLMAVDNLPAIVGTLLAASLPADTPTACVIDGATPRQRLVPAPLRELVATAGASGLTNPAVVVIGEVAGLAELPAAGGLADAATTAFISASVPRS
jgi:uroporphyrin-III C-methyltransferase/precorrin-2 dehydrogenase/sirohydrochlorin ferrochelatase